MKQTKKKSWIKENYIYAVIIGGLILVWIGTGIYQGSTSYICSKNSDKCVCEINKVCGIGIENCKEECWKFHLKTQAELDIDDCNNNPRDDEKCKCEEEEYDGCVGSLSIDLISGDTQCSKPQYKCIISRPKFNYEKHPEDYVAETKCIQYNKVQVLTNSTELACQPSLNMSGNEWQEWQVKMIMGGACPFPLVNTTVFTFSEIDGNECIQNQTTYHLKNECEKGNPDWVEETKLIFGETEPINCGEIIEGVNQSGCSFTPLINQTICREKTGVNQ